MKRKPPPAHMLTGSWFYEPVRAWIASGTFKHEPQPFGRDEVAASERSARGRQTALANGHLGTVTNRALAAVEGIAKSVQASRAANPRGAPTFTCGRCGVVSFLAGSRLRKGSRMCSTCGISK